MGRERHMRHAEEWLRLLIWQDDLGAAHGPACACPTCADVGIRQDELVSAWPCEDCDGEGCPRCVGTGLRRWQGHWGVP